MDPALRAAFNRAYTPELFERYRKRLEGNVGPVPFRLAETPVFLSKATGERLAEHARGIVAELSTPRCLAAMRAAVPAHYDVPRMDALPSCVQVDFALVRNEKGELDGKIVELQAFPSLYAFQVVQTRAWNEVLEPILGKRVDPYLGIDEAQYLAWLKKTVVSDADPEQVILLDIDPAGQKTVPDFHATKQLLDVDAVSITDLKREGRSLFRMKDGRRVPVKRIFNRVVFDELDIKKPELAFAYTDDLDVHWVPHPNWYWIWSKQSLPHLSHVSVPRSRRLSELAAGDGWPKDLSRYVLKPLYSYAGTGVKIDVTAADVDAIPVADRDGWLLQEKIDYARDLVAPDGSRVAVEIRVMCLRAEDEATPMPAVNLARFSRGKMHGVDHNKDMAWTGSSLGLINDE
jgi:hypothetical protein